MSEPRVNHGLVLGVWIFPMDAPDQREQPSPSPSETERLNRSDSPSGRANQEVEGQVEDFDQHDQVNPDSDNLATESAEPQIQDSSTGNEADKQENKQELVGDPDEEEHIEARESRPDQVPRSPSPNSGLEAGLEQLQGGEDREKAEKVPDYLASRDQEKTRQTTPRPPLDGEETEQAVDRGRQEEEDKPRMDDILQVSDVKHKFMFLFILHIKVFFSTLSSGQPLSIFAVSLEEPFFICCL